MTTQIVRQLMAELATGQRAHVLPREFFPDEFGLVYVGGDLSVPTIIEAYTKGCFPWTGEAPIPWFSPDPRLVLFPGRFRASRSLRKLARQKKYTIRFDRNFRGVMENCADIPRKGEKGTWITRNMIDAYCALHVLRIAHSVEVYDRDDQLCGGLYGLVFGRSFFGESMFSRTPNTSKLALFALCRMRAPYRLDFIDCQQVTAHMLRMGATPLRHREYRDLLRRTLLKDSGQEKWSGLEADLTLP